MTLIKQLFDENKSLGIDKKHLRKFLLTKDFYKYNGKKLELPTCSICVCDISLKQKTILIKCGHMYHDTCLIGCLKVKKNCPMYRYNPSMYK
jgi:hypothetical protein